MSSNMTIDWDRQNLPFYRWKNDVDLVFEFEKHVKSYHVTGRQGRFDDAPREHIALKAVTRDQSGEEHVEVHLVKISAVRCQTAMREVCDAIVAAGLAFPQRVVMRRTGQGFDTLYSATCPALSALSEDINN